MTEGGALATTGRAEAGSEPEEAMRLIRGFLADRMGASAAGVVVVPLSGDASTRRYFRLREGERTTVLALYPEPFVAEESTFVAVHRLLVDFGLPVPEILDEDGRRGILLLEDLGDLTLQEVLKTASLARREELYRQAVEGLVVLQREAARGAKSGACFQIAFDLEKLTWELHYFLKHFLEGFRQRNLSVEDRALLAEHFHRLAEDIASWPRVLCHRDFHSRNLMLHQGSLVWIDFQDARLGPMSYDLASLLRDSYVDLDEGFVAERAEEFRQMTAPEEPRDAFHRRFELMSVQRNLKALGTFGFMATMRSNPVYLPYIAGTLAHARRNLSRHPELQGLWRVLARHLEELT
ncbi:MAG TPA: phosphotransferase [Vicinamibacteria bacterium]|nr:phosphotransferase [Vicinamibacteria bacterium]